MLYELYVQRHIAAMCRSVWGTFVMVCWLKFRFLDLSWKIICNKAWYFLPNINLCFIVNFRDVACIGRFGVNCSQSCPLGYYGRRCNETCNCNFTVCDEVTGCLKVTSGKRFLILILSFFKTCLISLSTAIAWFVFPRLWY